MEKERQLLRGNVSGVVKVVHNAISCVTDDGPLYEGVRMNCTSHIRQGRS